MPIARKGREVMLKAKWILSLTTGALLSAVCAADEAQEFSEEPEVQPATAVPNATLGTEPIELPDLQMTLTIESLHDADDWMEQVVDIRFQNRSIESRLNRLDSIRFWTLADDGKTRFFLGVNKKGYLGFHFGAHPRDDESRDRSRGTVHYPVEVAPYRDTD